MAVIHREFVAFEDSTALTRQLSNRVVSLLREGIHSRGIASLMVSGGTTPIALFDSLSDADLDWERVLISLTDERWIDPSDGDSNELLVRTHLLKNRAAAAGFIGLKTPDSTAGAAEVACSRLIRQIPMPFDVLILGMGNDGHTASLFPGAAVLSQALDLSDDRLCRAVSPPTAPHDRMTLTLSALLHSRLIFVHIIGESKRAVYEKAIQGKSPEEMPIRAILSQERVPVTIWWAP